MDSNAPPVVSLSEKGGFCFHVVICATHLKAHLLFKAPPGYVSLNKWITEKCITSVTSLTGYIMYSVSLSVCQLLLPLCNADAEQSLICLKKLFKSHIYYYI